MTLHRTRLAWTLFGWFATLTPAIVVSASCKIQPLNSSVEYSASSASSPWSEYIFCISGRKSYVLWLEPEKNVHGAIVIVNLILNEAGDENAESNLLAAVGNWHGLEAYDFAALDLIKGPANSAFGPSRTIRVERKHLVVKIDLLEARVQRRLPDGYEIGQLRLNISVQNLPTKAQARTKAGTSRTLISVKPSDRKCRAGPCWRPWDRLRRSGGRPRDAVA